MQFFELIEAVLELEPAAFVERHPSAFLLEEDPEDQRQTRYGVRKRAADDDEPGGERRVFELVKKGGEGGELLVGRGVAADVRIEDSQVSTRHATLRRDAQGAWLVTDLRSLNGTRISGSPVAAGVATVVPPGATVTFGTRAHFALFEPARLHQVLRALGPRVLRALKLGQQRGETTRLKGLADLVERPPPPAQSPEATPAAPAAGRSFFLVCAPLAPTLLAEGREISVGRSSGNDLILPHASVSRRHASFTRTGGEVLVRDLGSSNGVVVNGAVVQSEATVRPGGSPVAVGVYELRVVAGDDPSLEPRAIVPEEEGTASLKADALRGRLETMPLAELLQAITINERTGFVLIDAPDGTRGQIHFARGKPLRALFGERRGTDAILTLLDLRAGGFTTTFWQDEKAELGPSEIEETFTKLLLESSRRADENER